VYTVGSTDSLLFANVNSLVKHDNKFLDDPGHLELVLTLGLLSWAWILIIVPQSSCPSHSQFASNLFTDDKENQKVHTSPIHRWLRIWCLVRHLLGGSQANWQSITHLSTEANFLTFSPKRQWLMEKMYYWHQSLKEMGLFPRETIFVQQRM